MQDAKNNNNKDEPTWELWIQAWDREGRITYTRIFRNLWEWEAKERLFSVDPRSCQQAGKPKIWIHNAAGEAPDPNQRRAPTEYPWALAQMEA